jgi:hypothetical protein
VKKHLLLVINEELLLSLLEEKKYELYEKLIQKLLIILK